MVTDLEEPEGSSLSLDPSTPCPAFLFSWCIVRLQLFSSARPWSDSSFSLQLVHRQTLHWDLRISSKISLLRRPHFSGWKHFTSQSSLLPTPLILDIPFQTYTPRSSHNCVISKCIIPQLIVFLLM